MDIKFSTLFLLMCATLPFVYSYEYSIESVKSNIFASLRPNRPPKEISECGKVAKEAYGLLKQTFKRGQAKEGSVCSWTLGAPANHVVNVISVGFELLDETSPEKHPDVDSGSSIHLYDGADSSQTLSTFSVTPKQLAGGFVSSISSKEDMLVKITYRDHLDYATQKVAIKYEFLNVDDMKRLLKAID